MTPNDFKAWRAAMGWTQKTTAERLNIHKKTVSNYERGAVPIPVVVRLATERLTLAIASAA